MKRWLATAGLVLGCMASTALAQTGEIESLGHLLPGTPLSIAYGVSPDGQSVTGQSRTTNNRNHIFLWTPPGPMQDLGAFIGQPIPNIDAVGNDVSANGVTVGASESQVAGPPSRAFRKIGAGAVQLLPTLPGIPAGGTSAANDVSDDGNIIVGQSNTAVAGQTRGFVFNASTNQTLPLGTIVPNTGNSVATSCSGNGALIVGYSSFGALTRACTFTVGGNATDLGSLDPAGSSVGLDVSANGTTVVGYATLAGPIHAFRWTQPSGMVDLGSIGNIPANSSIAYAAANNGVVVGISVNPGFGGQAAIWRNGPGSGEGLLSYIQSLGADITGWTTLDSCYDISDDGRYIVGYGTFNGAPTAFRVTIAPNTPPSVTTPAPVTVECDGVVNLVTLNATVNDPDPGELLSVVWSVNGIPRQTTNNVVPGSNSSFTFDFPHGASNVSIQVSDGTDVGNAATTVTVADTTDPIVVVAPEITRRVDRGEVFATIVLSPPSVSDVCDPNPLVTNNAPGDNRFPIGRTNVVWTVTDDDGNVATATQRVIVENRAPTANAGANVNRTSSGQRVTVRLNGSRSRDPDRHDLTFLWRANRARIADRTSARTTGRFRIGTTRVTLTVTDEAGARSTDSMIVRIRRVSSARASAVQADKAVRAAHDDAAASLANGGGASAAQGLSLTRSAYALGALAGVDANVNGDASADDLTAYLSLRQQQANVARQAGDQFLQSFLASGDENALAAGLAAYSASGHAQADLSSSQVTEVLAATVEQDE